MDLDKFITGLALAAIGAVTWVAYKHPEGYKRLYWPLLITLWITYTCLNLWDVSSAHTYAALLNFIPREKAAEAQKIVAELVVLKTWLHVVYWFLIGYTVFLSYLHEIL